MKRMKSMKSMNSMKKMLSLLLTALMVFSMGMTVFAANGTGTITVKNTTAGIEYAAYKIFDATISGEGNDKIAYTIKKTDAWFSIVDSSDSPFMLTETSTRGTYNVSVKDDMEAANVVEWLNKQTPAGLAAVSGTGNGGELDLGTVDYGYYFITSSLGAAVTVSSVNPNAVVIDKNQKPGWDPEDPKDDPDNPDTGKFVSETGEKGSYAKYSTAGINDTAYFKIAAHVPAYAGKTQVNDYTFTDMLGEGFTYNEDSMKLTIEGVTLSKGIDYVVTANGQNITIVIHASAIEGYPADAHVVMTYTAKVDKDAEYKNVNTVSMSWDYVENPKGDEPKPPEVSETTTYVYGFNLVKIDKDTQVVLKGAEFKLLNDELEEIPVVLENGIYRVATEGETGVSIEAGNVKIFGLDAGRYFLEETKQPDGYNMLTEPYGFKLQEIDSYDEAGISTSPVKVENSAGTTLPSTGGIGTTIFYVLGGLLMAGAVVILITRKRVSANKER